MEYGQQVLARSSQMRQMTRTRSRSKRFVDAVACAYCAGSGVDPKYANASQCPVCSGSGQVKVRPPVVTCLKCHGSGRQNGDLSCLACNGRGVVSVRKEATTCPKCMGTGERGRLLLQRLQGARRCLRSVQ